MIRNLGFAGAIAAMFAVTPAVLAQDADYAPERRALLVSIIEQSGCKVDGVNPPQSFLDAMEEHAFDRDETQAIAGALLSEGLATADGPSLILKSGKCAE
ncbi:MAG: hypothetical protein AAF439_09480 [Pseudomonadota bacterium]